MSLTHLLRLPAGELEKTLKPVVGAANREQRVLAEKYLKKNVQRKTR